MILEQRISAFVQLKAYFAPDNTQWQDIKFRASKENGWFIEQYVDNAVNNICQYFLDETLLTAWTNQYHLPTENPTPKKVGLVMAGNIPLVGFHDLLCILITGNIAVIKPSSKDTTLMKYVVNALIEINKDFENYIFIQDQLKNCDAYIATGSNNSGRYFEYYFGKFPNIIRKNRTSLGVLTGNETPEELELLIDDILLYFGLGCRNISKLMVPENYNFEPLINHLKKYDWLADNQKYKNNYDYNLSLILLNHQYYMTSGSLLVVEKEELFSAIGQLNYEFYKPSEDINFQEIMNNRPDDIQCIVGHGYTPFGQAQKPQLADYADGVDTMAFLTSL